LNHKDSKHLLAKKLRDLAPGKPRVYYKGAGDFMNGQMGSMKYEQDEIDNLLKVDPATNMVKRLREIESAEVDIDKSSPLQVKLIAREVLKACNVIRPSVKNLSTLPLARK